MPILTDPSTIRALLRRDPAWSAYALCDLAPTFFPFTQWFAPGPTLVLHAYGTCIMLAMDSRSLPEAMAHVAWPFHVQARDDVFAEVRRLAHLDHDRRMWRMLRTGEVGPLESPGVVSLGRADIPALRVLYADGDATGEAPDFFIPSTVDDGAYFGVYEGPELVAAAGTHVLARQEGAAAIGNVYTRRDRRGRGLARAVTTAVLRALADVETVVLNVRHDNAAALALYETLGFSRHCLFHEAVAVSPGPTP